MRLPPSIHPATTALRRALGAASVLLAGALQPTEAHAQLFQLHGIYATGETSHRTVHGLGGLIAGVTAAGPLVLMEAAGIDYVREPALGAGQGSLLGSLSVAPNRDSWLAPYVGGALSANRSGGVQGQWSGTKLGADEFLGVRLANPSSIMALTIEERVGMIHSQERMRSTRIGLVLAI